MARRFVRKGGLDATFIKKAHVFICWCRYRLPVDSPPEAGTDTSPMRVGEDGALRPEILFQSKPEYTAAARNAGTRGAVVVEALIDTEGCVQSVKALRKLPDGLTESAMNAVRKWVFSPATLADKPVVVYYVLTVHFSIGL